MKRLLALSTALAILPLAGHAADLPARYAAPAPQFVAPPPVFTWTGFYVGAAVGGVASDVNISDTGNSYYSWNGGKPSLTQFTAGGYVGYNHQFGNFVAGVEGDLNARFGSDESSFDGPAISYGWRTRSKWDASVRLRLGFLVTPRALIYGTGGVAWADFKYDNPACPSCADWGDANILGGTRTGWTLGGGIEYALDSNWHAKLEYLYTQFGSKSFDTSYSRSEDFYGRSKINSHTIRVGLSYRFGGPAASVTAPVVAAY